LCEEKGQLVLLEAIDQLVAAGYQLELCVIGDGPMREVLERRIERSGLGDSVRLLGWRSSDEVRSQMLLSRALIVSSFAEGLPGVIQEALALGRPVVSTNIMGIPELVLHGENGWLVPPGAVQPLADAIKEVITAPVRTLEERGRRGAKRAREEHDIRKQVAKLEKLIRDSLDRKL
jgi:colanic acid/amylovoran biosynthesis glycosyltransferase